MEGPDARQHLGCDPRGRGHPATTIPPSALPGPTRGKFQRTFGTAACIATERNGGENECWSWEWESSGGRDRAGPLRAGRAGVSRGAQPGPRHASGHAWCLPQPAKLDHAQHASAEGGGWHVGVLLSVVVGDLSRYGCMARIGVFTQVAVSAVASR